MVQLSMFLMEKLRLTMTKGASILVPGRQLSGGIFSQPFSVRLPSAECESMPPSLLLPKEPTSIIMKL